MIDRRLFMGGAAALLASRGYAAPAPARMPSLVDAFAAEHGFNGIVAHARNGRRDYIGTFGQADVEAARPISLTTRFAFGSASKWLTAVAVLGLALAHGRVDAAEATRLALLDESWQQDFWGEDEEALARKRAIAKDVALSARLLALARD